ncbi:hypothetical protein ABH932_006453 [Streptacidiphilus sp. MAP5-52]
MVRVPLVVAGGQGGVDGRLDAVRPVGLPEPREDRAVQLVTRPHITGLWSQAGSVARFEPSGAHVEEADGPHRHEEIARQQELVFIGTGLQHDALRRELYACLLSDDELAGDETAWRAFDGPFPAWDNVCEVPVGR